MAPPKKYLFRGEMRTTSEISELRGLSVWTVRDRLRHGKDLEAPLCEGHGRPPTRFEYNGRMVTYEEYSSETGVSQTVARQRRHKGTSMDLPPSAPRPEKRSSARQFLESLDGNVLVDRGTRYEDDDRCWYVTEVHPDGVTLEEVGQLMCVTRERVRQVQAKALRKLRALGVTHRDLISMKRLGARLHELRDRASANDNPAVNGRLYIVSPTALPSVRKKAV